MEFTWNPWHGCRRYSEGCKNCYVYRSDEKHGIDSSVLSRNKSFDMPVKKKKDGSYKIPSGSLVYTCFTSDFLFEDADEIRNEAWGFMRERGDVDFLFLTKRITRLKECLPSDWGNGYPNVIIGCTCENQKRADERLPVFMDIPVSRRIIICEPMLTEMHIEKYLQTGKFAQLLAGGESGNNARTCDYRWILSLREQCAAANVDFSYHQTGARLLKDGRLYTIPRKYQHSQARKAGIGFSAVK